MFSQVQTKSIMRTRKAACLLGVSLLACQAGMAQAQDDDNDGGDEGVEEIVVTGQRATIINSIRDKKSFPYTPRHYLALDFQQFLVMTSACNILT